MSKDSAVPDEVRDICVRLANAGFEAYLVGGCVRDILLKRKPKDWDVATNAKPEQLQKLFDDSVYENDFGTVIVKTEEEEEGKIKAVEVTTYRIEGKYSDKRHPDEVKFAKTIEEDLSRRDFTVNALALRIGEEVAHGIVVEERSLIDPFGGQDDLKKGIVRAVGNAEERFREDALRLMRAVRFAVELDFDIEIATRRAVEKLAGGLEMIAKERIRDEFEKMIMSPRAAKGILLLEDLDLLR